MSEPRTKESGSETRARRRIRQALEAKGWTVEEMRWEPIRAGGEKEGPEGGWYVEARAPSGGKDWVMGYNVQDALDWIERWIPADKSSPLGQQP